MGCRSGYGVMVNKPKAIGTKGETAICRVFQTHGFPGAERRALGGAGFGEDRGDLLICPGIVVECKWGKHAKNASLNDISRWWKETAREVRNAGAELGLLVIQRNGIGPERASLSRCFFDAGKMLQSEHVILEAPLITVIHLLRSQGWGDE
jgi:hypothetical protein